ncbi:acyl transferase [Mongoliibacter ruber]|uniref:Acyl-protein synthetase LuxE n=1 Tax=Mongoliibacter ruber TaxID=1750599 RepID=A0A2T0WMV5_9BACT|nr:acyl transferase [Mongoliibacter ruber]PRY88002.1 acyl-protein synthetase LuxE [Mongoliibacter ruber]
MTNYKTTKYFKSFEQDIPAINENIFEMKALELFRFQAEHNNIYKSYINARKIEAKNVKSLEQIPFLPIRFFKDHKVICGSEHEFQDFYSSSGTTGVITSRHYFWSEKFYLEHALRLFEKEYGSIRDFHVLALLPAYLERKGSSLVSMAQYFIEQSRSDYSGFYLYNQQELLDTIISLGKKPGKILLLGVTFALLDLAESGLEFPKTPQLIVMETGGMKGRRKEMIREEVHQVLKKYFRKEEIHSEYGMTELLSQAYSKGDGKYTLPNSMHIMLRDVNDPFTYSNRKQGGINVIDLANFHSCAFIETQDLGRFDKNGNLEILGRMDNSEIRGCNLMVN